jgi:hypothetical protein
MSDTTTSTTETTTTAPPPPADVVTMTKAELDALINGRVGQAVALAEKKRTTVPAETIKELDELRGFKAEQERKKLEEKGEYQKALDAQAKAIAEKYEPELAKHKDTIAKRDERLRREIVTNGLLSAAATGNAISPDEVVALLGPQVKLNDDFEPQVLDAQGNPRFAPDGQPMTPAQLVEEFLRTRPYFVKASGGKSAGAGGGPTTKGAGTPTAVSEKEKEVAELAELARRNTSDLGLLAKHARASKELAELKAKGV